MIPNYPADRKTQPVIYPAIGRRGRGEAGDARLLRAALAEDQILFFERGGLFF